MIRAVVLYFSKPSNKTRMKGLAEALARGLGSQGAQVDVIDGTQSRDLKLTGYHYLAVGCDVRSIFKGALPPELASMLGNAGIVTGKKAFAFVPSAMVGADSTLLKLMRALEHEGILLRYSECLAKVEDAQALGLKLKLV